MKTITVEVPDKAFNVRVTYDVPARPATMKEHKRFRDDEERAYIKKIREIYSHDRFTTPGLQGDKLLALAHASWDIAEDAVGWNAANTLWDCKRDAETIKDLCAQWDSDITLVHDLAEKNLALLVMCIKNANTLNQKRVQCERAEVTADDQH